MAKYASESWEAYARRATEHLKGLRKGSVVVNIRSKQSAVATKRLSRKHPYVQVVREVIRIRKKGKTKRRTPIKLYTAWSADNVSLFRA